jgi:hypothetical protein
VGAAATRSVYVNGGSAKRFATFVFSSAVRNIRVLERGLQHSCSRARFATFVFSSAVCNIRVLERGSQHLGFRARENAQRKKTDSISPSAVVKKLGAKRVQKNTPQKNGQHFP